MGIDYINSLSLPIYYLSPLRKKLFFTEKQILIPEIPKYIYSQAKLLPFIKHWFLITDVNVYLFISD